MPIAIQLSKLRWANRYHAVPGNLDRLSVFGQRLRRSWRLLLRRRSQRRVAWDRLTLIFARWIPAPRVLGLKIERPEEISSRLKKALAMEGPVLVGVPVDYRDKSPPDGDCASRSAELRPIHLEEKRTIPTGEIVFSD